MTTIKELDHLRKQKYFEYQKTEYQEAVLHPLHPGKLICDVDFQVCEYPSIDTEDCSECHKSKKCIKRKEQPEETWTGIWGDIL